MRHKSESVEFAVIKKQFGQALVFFAKYCDDVMAGPLVRNTHDIQVSKHLRVKRYKSLQRQTLRTVIEHAVFCGRGC